MQREHIEKLDNPTWKAAYDRHLAKGESLHGHGHADALTYASTAADLEFAEGEEAEAARAEREAAILADHNARKAVEADQPIPAPAPAVAPTTRAKAGWAKAIGEINANFTNHPKPAQGEPAQSVGALLDQQDQRKAKATPEGWAKAAAAANAERGV